MNTAFENYSESDYRDEITRAIFEGDTQWAHDVRIAMRDAIESGILPPYSVVP